MHLASPGLEGLRRSREKVFKRPPIEWINDRLEHLQDVLDQRTERSAQVLRQLLGPIRLELTAPDIGRPFYRAITSIVALALSESPSVGAEGGSNSLQRWRRRESNPRFVPAVVGPCRNRQISSTTSLPSSRGRQRLGAHSASSLLLGEGDRAPTR